MEADRRKKKRVERPQRAGERKSEELLESSESKEKKKGEDVLIWVYVCG